MKLVMDIFITKLLVTAEQADAISNILHGCEFIDHVYQANRVPGSPQYIDLIKPAVMRDVIKVGVMSQIEYDAMALITKLQVEK